MWSTIRDTFGIETRGLEDRLCGSSLPPLRGLGLILRPHPQLAPWAAFFRRFAAGAPARLMLALYGASDAALKRRSSTVVSSMQP
mgnify:CR=1 FL=1